MFVIQVFHREEEQDEEVQEVNEDADEDLYEVKQMKIEGQRVHVPTYCRNENSDDFIMEDVNEKPKSQRSTQKSHDPVEESSEVKEPPKKRQKKKKKNM